LEKNTQLEELNIQNSELLQQNSRLERLKLHNEQQIEQLKIQNEQQIKELNQEMSSRNEQNIQKLTRIQERHNKFQKEKNEKALKNKDGEIINLNSKLQERLQQINQLKQQKEECYGHRVEILNRHNKNVSQLQNMKNKLKKSLLKNKISKYTRGKKTIEEREREFETKLDMKMRWEDFKNQFAVPWDSEDSEDFKNELENLISDSDSDSSEELEELISDSEEDLAYRFLLNLNKITQGVEKDSLTSDSDSKESKELERRLISEIDEKNRQEDSLTLDSEELERRLISEIDEKIGKSLTSDSEDSEDFKNEFVVPSDSKELLYESLISKIDQDSLTSDPDSDEIERRLRSEIDQDSLTSDPDSEELELERRLRSEIDEK
jgi:hypothetical protein